ncbi:MAG: heme NO-binding domain-containing protein [Rhodobacterales bacterium]|nr:heme NO-binding domain-containing protein [Rhodobacterales bacterium]MDX5412951.1 heme NO-binding domain-containing protein [Rhodobacterales bacterium]
MHGLVNRAIQCFVTDMHGNDTWQAVARGAGLDGSGFEAMLNHDPAVTRRVLSGAAQCLDRPEVELLEDIGTYIVSHPNVGALRRLLRFGGDSFVDFLYSLDDLRDRARLAVSDLELPELELHDQAADRYSLHCLTGAPHHPAMRDFGHVMMGVLRAMADDYGALVVLDHRGLQSGREVIEITLVERAFSTGRSFDLGQRAG